MIPSGKTNRQLLPSDYKIILVGAGNVATRLGLCLRDRGVNISGVFSRSTSANVLADKLKCKVYDKIAYIPEDTDMVLIATSDASVATVSVQLPKIKGVIAHTSGSIPLEALTEHHKHAAVLYPLQTFSKDVEVDISKVPFFIEASDAKAYDAVKNVAMTLSDNVNDADSAIRSKLHIAGVLSSNFTVYLLKMTQRVLQEINLPLDTVAPLVEATIKKTFAIGPEQAITGPARRGDIAVIDKQMAAMPEGIDKQIYALISNAILKEFHPNAEL